MVDEKPISEATTLSWIAAFDKEPPLFSLFPVTLVNGKTVPGVHVVCSKCKATISGDRVHGRVIQSLANVVTVAANGYCEQCDRMTHIDCRFRAMADETVVEWMSSNGRWYAKELRRPTLTEKVIREARRFLTWFNTA
jgi:hypothetical protein